MKDSCSWGGNSPVEETGGKGRLVGGLKNGAITAAVQLRRGGRSTRDRGREHSSKIAFGNSSHSYAT
ncbi:hypothetical protein PVAP13_9NG673300 [Panicum virgatum]|uniref:Uncharacterized protein n=1 Tax=Panicum virgatum TaxID=38727 RepID=A0A8T0MY43_PANVG|nr:hypothetical protein PVAP13_9NG673300 [Panicum virgatum]